MRLGSFALLSAILGCGGGQQSVSTPVSGVTISGHVQVAKQAVTGATVSLFAAGNAGYGVGATSLLNGQAEVSNASGAFAFTANFTCPTSTTPVYLVSRGGSPSGAVGSSNPALVLVAPLGDCGTVNTSIGFTINEASTVATAWSLSQFLGAGANVGSSATNLQGLRNAFDVAMNLVDPALGTTPAATFPASASMETAKLDTLADIVSACANSNGGVVCSALFSAATFAGGSPTNTLDAVANIVRNPGTNVSSVFHLSLGGTPFLPVLSAAPHDWTLSLTYGKCSSGCGGLDIPGALGIDSTGNAWVANYFGAVVSEFSPVGVPLSANGFPGVGLSQSYGLAIDGTGNVWVTNEQSVAAAGNSRHGSVSRFSASGTELSSNGYIGGGIYYPVSIAADTNGAMWVADYGSSASSLLTADGSSISGSSGYATSQLPFTQAVTLDANHNAWFAVQGAAVRVSATGGVASFSCCNDPTGLAVDPSGSIWLADYPVSTIEKVSANGAVLATVSTAAQSSAPLAIAIDGAGNIWTANYFGNSITTLAGSTASIISPGNGYGLDASLNEPYFIAVDAGGNLWLSNSGNNTLTEIVSIAKPVKTPTLGPPIQP